ncbi:MAG: hypothetical protein QXH24_02640 [Candidatus Bathyarchaeia archaeon]
MALHAIREAIHSCGIDKENISAILVEPSLTDTEWTSHGAWSGIVERLSFGWEVQA